MPILNPDKCYTQQPQCLTITETTNLSNHWRTDFYELLSVQLKLGDETPVRRFFRAYELTPLVLP